MEAYLDNSATTKCFESVAGLMTKVMCEDYGNPSSMHTKGMEAEKYLRNAKYNCTSRGTAARKMRKPAFQKLSDCIKWVA